MDERFLHFAWQYLQFPTQDLHTVDGKALHILHQGSLNSHAGPDFLNARLRIGELEWAGHVEIHVKSADWNLHKHQEDKAYDNVVLHVVWEHNSPVHTSSDFLLPTLELKNLIDPQLIYRYRKLLNNVQEIPCQEQWTEVSNLEKISQLEKSLISRLQRKSQIVHRILDACRGDWEETSYQWLARHFGFKTNQDAFEDLSRQLPWQIVQKNLEELSKIEALLFGMSGFLDGDAVDEYHAFLQREYRFLSHKYQLQNLGMHRSQWKFLRLRPGNFPSVRLAEFASYLHHFPKVFSQFRSISEEKELLKKWDIPVSNYWQEHYDFGKKRKQKSHGMGESSIHNLLLNTAPILLTAYSQAQDDPVFLEKALEILQKLKAENNFVIKKWLALDWHAKSAFDSQGMLELYNEYCQRKRCLQCTIGTKLMRS